MALLMFVKRIRVYDVYPMQNKSWVSFGTAQDFDFFVRFYTRAAKNRIVMQPWVSKTPICPIGHFKPLLSLRYQRQIAWEDESFSDRLQPLTTINRMVL